jgi:adenylate cyclase
MCVGFVDLVGSTTLAQRLPTRELGAVLTEFEDTAADTITALGGRLVKLIGDEVLYTTLDERVACTIALKLSARFQDHPIIPPVRAGIAAGDVLLRSGDVFGPVVNLAARAVKLAGPGQVVTTIPVARRARIRADTLTAQDLKGLDTEGELCRLIPA